MNRQTAKLPMLVVCFLFLSVCLKGESGSNYDSNTAIKVLLERGTKRGKVRSLLNATYVRANGGAGWVLHEKDLEISERAAKSPFIQVGDQYINDSSLFVRGGPYPSDKLEYQGNIYRGALKWVRQENGFLVTNHVSLEDYLRGILGTEMSASWEIEALKAQAVASRTYALYMIQHPKNPEFDLEGGIQDQAYAPVQGPSEKIKSAITLTMGQVLAVDGKPFKSFFHSRCGGNTENPQNVWNTKSPLTNNRVTCPFCIQNPYSWKVGVAIDELLRLVNLPYMGTFRIAPGLITPTGRVASLKLMAGGKETTLPTDELRSLVGYTKLKSAKFGWKISGGEVSFEGVGNGHGVGMCQWGARYLAQQGKTYREILQYYYPQSRLISASH